MRSLHPELLSITAIALLLIVTAALRREFGGDGVRYLDRAVSLHHPVLGPPRELAVPFGLFLLIRPLVVAGWVTSVEQAVQPWLWLDVVAGIALLLSLRRWLAAEGVAPAARAAAVLVAGSCASFIILYSDITEPQVAASLVIAAAAAARARSRAGSGDRAALMLTAVIAVASLFYQGLLLAVALVPLVVPRDTWGKPRVLVSMAAILAAVPLTIVVAALVSGAGTGRVVGWFLGEDTALARSLLTSSSPLKFLAAALAGPPQAIVGLDHFSGLPALFRGLSKPETAALATENMMRLAVGGVVFAAMIRTVVTRRDWPLALAMLAVVTLPVVRNQQYNYPKFYVLWPALVAVASTMYRPRSVLIAAAVVLTLNVSLTAREVAHGRQLYAQLRRAYAAADSSTCWMTSGFAPPLPYLWPGSSAAILGTLAADGSPEALAARLTQSLTACFCRASSVWTDTTIATLEVVEGLAEHFRYTDVSLSDVVFRAEDGTTRTDGPLALHLYSRDAALRVCSRMPPRSTTR